MNTNSILSHFKAASSDFKCLKLLHIEKFETLKLVLCGYKSIIHMTNL